MERISRYRSTEKQTTLFPEPLGKHGHIRTVIGNLAEDLTAFYFGGKRHRCQNDHYCPDVSVILPFLTAPCLHAGSTTYFECKAVGTSRTAFVYSGRVKRDQAFAAQHELNYVFWHHLTHTKKATTVVELETLVLQEMQSLYVVPFNRLASVVSRLPEEKLNSAYYGPAATREGQQNTYGSGYRIPLSLLAGHEVPLDRSELAAFARLRFGVGIGDV